MQKTSISTSRPSAALRMWASFKSHLPTRASTSGTWHRSSVLPGVPPRTPHHRPRSATALRPHGPRQRRTPGRRPNRRLRDRQPARSSAAIDCRHTHGTGRQMPNMPGQTDIPSRRGFPLGTVAPPPSRLPRMAPTPLRLARPGPGDETVTPRSGREREEGLDSVQAPQQHTGTPPGDAPDFPGHRPPSVRPARATVTRRLPTIAGFYKCQHGSAQAEQVIGGAVRDLLPDLGREVEAVEPVAGLPAV
jgi:hypothetical protein